MVDTANKRHDEIVRAYEAAKNGRIAYHRAARDLLLKVTNGMREYIGWKPEQWSIAEGDREPNEHPDLHPGITHGRDGYARCCVELKYGDGSLTKFRVAARIENDNQISVKIAAIERSLKPSELDALYATFYGEFLESLPGLFGPWTPTS